MNHKQHLTLLAAVVILIYLNSFKGTFQLDDYNVIVFNPAVHKWSTWWADTGNGIRPFLKFTYTLNWTSNMGLFGFHLFNLSIHIINTILIYALSQDLVATQQNIPDVFKKHIPFIVALLFAVHPINAEAVTYVSGRSASLMTLFYMSSLLAYAHGRDACKPLFIFILSPVLFLFAVSVKEVAITLPAALLLWETTVRKTAFSLKKAFGSQWVHWMLLCSIGFSILTHPGYRRLISFSMGFRSIHDNLLSQIHGVVYLISRLMLVNRLNIDPDLPIVTRWSPELILEASFLCAILVTGILCWKKYRWASFGICWFFLNLLPANSFIPRIDIINERHFYLAGWGIIIVFSISIALFFSKFIGKQQYFWICFIILSLTLGGFTISRNHVYRSEIALWEDTAQKSINKARIFNNLGYAYYLAGRFDEARKAYLRALYLDPDFTLAQNNLSLIEK
jgi:protein O-mannosyl-transferase